MFYKWKNRANCELNGLNDDSLKRSESNRIRTAYKKKLINVFECKCETQMRNKPGPLTSPSIFIVGILAFRFNNECMQ